MEAKKVTRRTFLKMAGAAGGAALAASGGAGALADAFKAPARQETVTLTSNDFYLGGPGFEPIAEAYREVLDAAGLDWIQYEYQQADTTTLETRMAAGDAPDLIYVYPELAQPWAARNQLVSLTPHIDADPDWKADVEAFIPSMNAGYTYNGELYALTTAAEAECCSFNPDRFAAKGVDSPSAVGAEAFTLEKFREMNCAIADDEMGGYFGHMEFNQGLGDIVACFGGQYFSEDGTQALLNTPEFVAAVEYVAGMVRDGCAIDGIQSTRDGQWVAAALANQLCATVIAGDWAWGWAHKTQLEAGEFQPEMFYIPSGPAGRIPIAHSAGVALYASTSNMDAGLAFMKFGFTKEFQEVAAKMYEVAPQFPARTDAADPIFDNELLPAFFTELFEGSIPSPFTPVINPYPLYGYMYDMWADVFKGNDTRPIQEVQDEMNDRVQRDLDDAAFFM
ncbi:MAG: hypothetical protein Kow00120_05430 [Anaerolineae bacterium]